MLQTTPIRATGVPANGQLLGFNGSLWVPTTPPWGLPASPAAGNLILATPDGSPGTVTLRNLSDGDVSFVHLSALAAPTKDVPLNAHRITGLADGVLNTDAATWGQVQALISNSIPGADWIPGGVWANA